MYNRHYHIYPHLRSENKNQNHRMTGEHFITFLHHLFLLHGLTFLQQRKN